MNKHKHNLLDDARAYLHRQGYIGIVETLSGYKILKDLVNPAQPLEVILKEQFGEIENIELLMAQLDEVLDQDIAQSLVDQLERAENRYLSQRSKWFSDDGNYAFPVGKKLRLCHPLEKPQIYTIESYLHNIIEGDSYLLTTETGFRTVPKKYLETPGHAELLPDQPQLTNDL